MTEWREQYDRVKLFYDRIQDRDRDWRQYEADLWAFFQNYWHLKDWIKNDNHVRRVMPDISKRIEEDVYPALEKCADLCNRSKHNYGLVKKARKAKRPRKDMEVRGDIKAELGDSLCSPESTGRTSIDYVVACKKDGTEESALDVAREALKAWDDLIRRYAL